MRPPFALSFERKCGCIHTFGGKLLWLRKFVCSDIIYLDFAEPDDADDV